MKARRQKSNQQSGAPGGGKGMREDVHGSGVYPASGPWPEHEAGFRNEGEWGHLEQARENALVPIERTSRSNQSERSGAGEREARGATAKKSRRQKPD